MPFREEYTQWKNRMMEANRRHSLLALDSESIGQTERVDTSTAQPVRSLALTQSNESTERIDE
jgi:hypothetical protein